MGKCLIKLWKMPAYNPSPGETKVGGSRVGGYVVRLCLKKTNIWRGFLMTMILVDSSQKSYTPEACQACKRKLKYFFNNTRNSNRFLIECYYVPDSILI